MLASSLFAHAPLLLADWGGFFRGLLVVGFIIFCILLILTILIQKPQGGGLAGAFGAGSGSGQTAFGTRTGDALTIFTVAVFVIYLLGAVGLTFAMRPGYDLHVPPSATSGEGTDSTKAPATGEPGKGAAPATDADKAPAAPAGSSPVPPFKVPEPAPISPAPAAPPASNPSPAPATDPATPPKG